MHEHKCSITDVYNKQTKKALHLEGEHFWGQKTGIIYFTEMNKHGTISWTNHYLAYHKRRPRKNKEETLTSIIGQARVLGLV